MTETVRLFIAIELPDPVRASLNGTIASLRPARIDSLRTVKPENLHLTLQFLGTTAADRVDAVKWALAVPSTAAQPFELRLAEPGVFPTEHRARVLWAGLDGDLHGLNELQRAIGTSLAELGFEGDASFSPHITLARLRDRASRDDRMKASRTLLHTPRHDASFTVTSVSLMRSTLRRTGAEYDRLARFPLGSDASG